MDLKLSSPKPDLSLSDDVSDHEEKEISDDDDDDRNHKHRRRDTRSQSLERDPLELVSTRSYRKRNRPFENEPPNKEANSQSRIHYMPPQQKGSTGNFDRRRIASPASRAPLDLSQRIRVNQSVPSDPGSGRGRGREPGHWTQRDQMVQQGSVLFAGRGMATVSNSQSASWNAFGLVPGLPNHGLGTLHSLGLQRTLHGPINPSMNMGIPLQRCRDFEERGFCLRGDMCPMEHGVNRIVVEDVQSLSQFNLPVSVPSAQLLGAAAGPGPLSSTSAPSSTLANSKVLYGKSSKPGGLGPNGAFVGSAVAGGADFYDPDQPLWTNDSSHTSTGPTVPNPTKVDGSESLLDANPSSDQHIWLYDGPNSERQVGSIGAIGSQSTSLPVSGRIHSSKTRMETTDKIDSAGNTAQGVAADHGKRTNADDMVHATGSFVKTLNGTGRNIPKQSPKAQRTLFVNGIPQKNNTGEALHSHFGRFGEIIDIYIPLNGERAFVQFSKREEAEAALKAPDAVMGNRFIKVWWANRDNIPDDGPSSGPSVPMPSPQTTKALKGNIGNSSVSLGPAFDHPKPVVTNGPLPPTQKKLESIELLKEELRKKQEMLDQKRNEFKRKLDKLEKQASGLKGEVAVEQTAKRPKLGTVADAAKTSTPTSIDPPSTIRPLAPAGAPPFPMNRFKLDNRPTSFKIMPPLPTGLANVDALKEYFSTYGELNNVDLECSELEDGGHELETSKSSARINFTTRHSAELAFSNAKSWRGHNMQFIWVSATTSSKGNDGRDDPSSASPKGSSDGNGQNQTTGEVVLTVPEKTAISADRESEVFERSDSSAEHMVPVAELHSNLTSTAMPAEKQSPPDDVC